MLPIVLSRDKVEKLMTECENKALITVNLEHQVVVSASGEQFKFEVDPFRKHCLLNGLDDIGLTMQRADKISQFEKIRSREQPWLDNAAQSYIV